MKTLNTLIISAILLPGFAFAQLEGKAFKADGRPTTGTLKVHTFYVDSIPSKKSRKDKVYGELKGAPKFVNHELDGASITIYNGDKVVQTGTTDNNGYFQWTDAPIGTYKIVASKPPYKDFTISKELQIGLLNEVECKMKQ